MHCRNSAQYKIVYWCSLLLACLCNVWQWDLPDCRDSRCVGKWEMVVVIVTLSGCFTQTVCAAHFWAAASIEVLGWCPHTGRAVLLGHGTEWEDGTLLGHLHITCDKWLLRPMLHTWSLNSGAYCDFSMPTSLKWNFVKVYRAFGVLWLRCINVSLRQTYLSQL